MVHSRLDVQEQSMVHGTVCCNNQVPHYCLEKDKVRRNYRTWNSQTCAFSDEWVCGLLVEQRSLVRHQGKFAVSINFFALLYSQSSLSTILSQSGQWQLILQRNRARPPDRPTCTAVDVGFRGSLESSLPALTWHRPSFKSPSLRPLLLPTSSRYR